MLDWKKEKFGQFKNKGKSAEERQKVRRKYQVFHVEQSGEPGMHLGHIYSESLEMAILHAEHWFSFMGKPILVIKSPNA